ncbi:cysteine dioxygenase family protein [Xanthobacter agilis]|uniref:cysteine dioxygenase family protein n=1 Tax=Xanthobacter agilis TaxID=47492 RepID=UPI00372BE9AC
MTARVPEALRRFIWDIQSMVELADSPREILFIGRDLMGRLVASDDWLPPVFAPDGDGPHLYELYRDDMERFCVVASVFAAGQGWPCFQDGVWEISGVLRGEVVRSGPGADARVLAPGRVETALGGEAAAWTQAGSPGAAVVIHVYGGDIGRMARGQVGPDGVVTPSVVGYANPPDAPAYDILSIQAEVAD